MRRRDVLGSAGGIAAAGLLAGCTGDGDGGSGGGENPVAAGPNNSFTFDPETITISTGETVTWTFESAGHNVECDPQVSDRASLPDGAEPFASYDGDNRFETEDLGATYEHTFDVAGTYDYVCVPHAGQGMVGTVVVEE